MISLFASAVMSSNKFIITETAIFSAKLIHHEEISKSSQENLTNFTNPLYSNIEAVNDTFIFKEAKIISDKLYFV